MTPTEPTSDEVPPTIGDGGYEGDSGLRTTRGERTRGDILAAAIDEFAANGFAGGSTLSIARAAHSRQPLLNYHFGSKEQLWRAAVDFAFVELRVTFDAIEETARDAAPLAVLRQMVHVLNRFASRHPKHVSILRQEMGSDSSRSRYLLDRHLRPMYRRIDAVVEAAITAGLLKPVPPQFVSSLLFGAVTHYFASGPLLQHVYSLDVTDRQQARTHGDWVVEILLRGLLTEQARAANGPPSPGGF